MTLANTQKKNSCFVSVIIVTHNSDRYIDRCISSLERQTVRPEEVIIVDSGSKNIPKKFDSPLNIKIIDAHGNIGFCEGNNVGYSISSHAANYLLFLNPDAFPLPEFIEGAIEIMRGDASVGILTGKLLGYDIDNNSPTKLIDSTGIFKTWYGRWYDRGQGETDYAQYDAKREFVPAICGALMFCRASALRQNLIRGSEIFDKSFFMYKEDIDLSCRLRAGGWKLLYAGDISSFHCRGWKSRRRISRQQRMHAAKNDIRVSAMYSPLSVPFSLVKYLLVKIFNA